MCSLNYNHEDHQRWDDNEPPPEIAGRMRKHELGRSNLHDEDYFTEKFQSLNLDPRLTNLIKKCRGVFRALPLLLSCTKLVEI